MEIKSLKEKLQNRGNISPNRNDDDIKNPKLQISVLKQENSFIKIELQSKKLLIKYLILIVFNQKMNGVLTVAIKTMKRLQELQTM